MKPKLLLLDKDGTLVAPGSGATTSRNKADDPQQHRHLSHHTDYSDKGRPLYYRNDLGERFIQHPADQVVLPGVREAITRYVSQGATPVIISNQGGVAAGHKTLNDAIEEMRYCMKLLPEIEIAYFCPDFQGNSCFGVTPSNYFSIVEYYIGDNDRWQMSTIIALPKDDNRVIGLCRKPNPGMLNLAIIRHLEYQGFSKEDAVMVGDRPEDEAAAAAAGVEFLAASQWWMHSN